MINHLYYLLSLSQPQGDKGKIIVFHRDGNYETQWTSIAEEVEETLIYYTGPEKEKAWQAVEALQVEKAKEGFTPDSTLLNLTLSAIPTSYQFIRKLECFSHRNMNDEIFQELRKWRRHAASKAQIPPYFIATDKLLSILSTVTPHHQDELVQIPGIGSNKAQLYGPGILEITQKAPQLYPFPLDWVNDKVLPEELAVWLLEEKVAKEEKRQHRQEQERMEKTALLEAIHQHVSIEPLAQKLSLNIAQLMKKILDLSKEGYDLLPYLESEVSKIQESSRIESVVSMVGSSRLKPIFEQLYGDGKGLASKERGEKYNQIRLICALVQLKSAS
ncbi:HRDC domain-containing protein [Ammoniphilus sp. YIM 78166]|uniref:HRDC domain-containing protein n=1 Tax=Ammoniphilus sp. YIM 78166 TaxID=1644106 RepID=UPI0010703418|nr:HRDC domain-containing protein [Ammoniphilus sp. YIM 78166]